LNTSKITSQEHASCLNKRIFLTAFLAILFGTSIYILWRPDTIKVFTWLDLVGLSAPIESIRSYSKNFLPIIPEWIVFSLPNGLWAFSYATIITYMWWERENSIFKVFWLSSIIVVGLGYEALQYVGAIPGTFCFQDLLLCITGVFLGVTITRLIVRRS
jgi:hypothetical protein